MRIYFSDKEDLITEYFYNEKGLEIREEREVDEVLWHTYEDTNLVRTVHEYPDNKREVTEYTYDQESNLVHCHWEEQKVRDSHDDTLIFPCESYSDEWYDWHNEGRTCIRTKENHNKDGKVIHNLIREEYDAEERLIRVHHLNDDLIYECKEFFDYGTDGTLSQKTKYTTFLSEDGKRRKIHSITRFSGEREISEEVYGIDSAGLVFSNFLTYEYEEDEEGNWVVSRQMNKDIEVFTLLREIEYW